MRTVVLIFLLSILCVSFPFAFAEESSLDAALQAKIKLLIEQLGADDFDTREAATEELVKIGIPAVDAIGEAERSPDPEVAWRAQKIVPRILNGLTVEEYKDLLRLCQKISGMSADEDGIRGDKFSCIRKMLEPYLPDGAPFVAKLLDDPNPYARYVACRMPGLNRDAKALSVIDRFLAEYGPLLDGREVEEKDYFKIDIVYECVAALNSFDRKLTSPIAEKYLRQPFVKMGDMSILQYGTWNASHYDAFESLAKAGLLERAEVTQYFLDNPDKRIIPFLKEQLKQGKQVGAALKVLGGIAPQDPDTKNWCIEYAKTDPHCYMALQVLREIDAETTRKLIREKLSAFLAVAARNEPCPFEGRRLLDLLIGIEGSKAMDVIEAAAVTPQLGETAASYITQSLPATEIDTVCKRILDKGEGDLVPLLRAMAIRKNSSLVQYLGEASYPQYLKDTDCEKIFRMIVNLKPNDSAECLLKLVPEIKSTHKQLRLLGLIACSRNAALLPEVEKAFAGFEERHRQRYKAAEDELKQKEGEEDDIARLEMNFADDMFEFAIFLNMLGKQNEAVMRSYLLENDFVAPSFYVPSLHDSGKTELYRHYKEVVAWLIKDDPDDKLKTRLHEIISMVLDQRYLFDATAETPDDAPFSFVNRLYHPRADYLWQYWPDYFSILVSLDDKEIIVKAVRLVEKYGAHPGYRIYSICGELKDTHRPLVVKFIRAHCEEVVKTKPDYDEAMEGCVWLTERLTGISLRNIKYRPTPKNTAALILEHLKE